MIPPTSFYHDISLHPVDYEELNCDKLSPKDRYQELSKRIQAVVGEGEIKKKYFQSTKKNTRKICNIFKTNVDQASPLDIPIGILAGGGIAKAVEAQINKIPPKNIPRSAPSKDKAVGLFGAALIGGGVAAYTVVLYKRFNLEMKIKILNTFNLIANDQIRIQQLLESNEESIRALKESWFNKVFEYYNPIPMSYLLLTNGISLDSLGSHKEAQQEYLKGLSYQIEDRQRETILFVYARSLRLSNSSSELILPLINQINEASPLNLLGQIERKIIDSNIAEVLEDGEIPFDFLCPITGMIMEVPTYYVSQGGNRYYFDNIPITNWTNSRYTCPITRQPLAQANLIIDDNLANAISIWNQTKLKKNEN